MIRLRTKFENYWPTMISTTKQFGLGWSIDYFRFRTGYFLGITPYLEIIVLNFAFTIYFYEQN